MICAIGWRCFTDLRTAMNPSESQASQQLKVTEDDTFDGT
jgi:hypothetical protein